jgi:Spy/CpxP family protein refolding chaperone
MVRRTLAVLLLTGAAFAQMQMAPQGPPPGGTGRRQNNMTRMRAPGMGMGMGMGIPGGKFWTNTDLAQKIGLTPAQIQQMEKIFQDSRLQLIDRVAAVRKAEVQLEPMVQADKPDEAQVLAQIDKIAQARADLEKTNARMMLGIRQVMSAEQWTKLKAEAPREMRFRREVRRQGGGPGGPGGPGAPGAPGGPPPAPQSPE